MQAKTDAPLHCERVIQGLAAQLDNLCAATHDPGTHLTVAQVGILRKCCSDSLSDLRTSLQQAARAAEAAQHTQRELAQLRTLEGAQQNVTACDAQDCATPSPKMQPHLRLRGSPLVKSQSLTDSAGLRCSQAKPAWQTPLHQVKSERSPLKQVESAPQATAPQNVHSGALASDVGRGARTPSRRRSSRQRSLSNRPAWRSPLDEDNAADAGGPAQHAAADGQTNGEHVSAAEASIIAASEPSPSGSAVSTSADHASFHRRLQAGSTLSAHHQEAIGGVQARLSQPQWQQAEALLAELSPRLATTAVVIQATVLPAMAAMPPSVKQHIQVCCKLAYVSYVARLDDYASISTSN